MDNDSPLTGSLTRSDERYISQGFAVINKNLDQILARLDLFDKKIDLNSHKIDQNAHRTDLRVEEVKDDFRNMTDRVVRIEAFFKFGAILGSFIASILSGIIMNNWGNLTAPSQQAIVQPSQPPYKSK